MRIKAAVLPAPAHAVEVRDVDLAEPKAGEVLVRMGGSGVCGSDLNVVDGRRQLVPYPAVLGHEAAGVVETVGPGVQRFSRGDHVVLTILPSCGHCLNCLRGRSNHCIVAADAMRAGNLLEGSSRLRDGDQRLNHFLTVSSFAECAVVAESNLTKIDAAMPLDRAALIGCAVLTGFGAVRNTAKVKRGDRVAVFGCGGVGLSAIQGARIAGADQIIAVDVQPNKRELAKAVGATHAIDAGQPEVPEPCAKPPTTSASTTPSRRPAAARLSSRRGSRWPSAESHRHRDPQERLEADARRGPAHRGEANQRLLSGQLLAGARHPGAGHALSRRSAPAR